MQVSNPNVRRHLRWPPSLSLLFALLVLAGLLFPRGASGASLEVLAAWGSLGAGPGQFNSPSAVAVDVDGNAYVADSFNHRLQSFDSAGAFVAKWGTLGSAAGQFRFPVGVSTGPLGEVYVAEGSPNHRIQVFGDPPPTIPDLIESVDGLALPHGIENSLKAKLRAAAASFERGQLVPTAHQLNALLAEIAALSGKKIEDDDAGNLTAEVEAPLRALACLS